MNAESTPGEPFRLLFVCTGNTCRSPMAEAIARRMVRELGWRTVEVSSAGVATGGGTPASPGAVRAAHRHGLDLSDHRSTTVTPELLADADLVLTMSASHLAQVVAYGAGDRSAIITAFAAGDAGAPAGVPDPFGGPDEVYEETFTFLEALVRTSLQRLAQTIAP